MCVCFNFVKSKILIGLRSIMGVSLVKLQFTSKNDLPTKFTFSTSIVTGHFKVFHPLQWFLFNLHT